MNKQLAERIVQNLDFKVMEVLDEYVEDRIKSVHNQLERESDPDIFRQHQGRLQELRTLFKIREYAVSTLQTKE